MAVQFCMSNLEFGALGDFNPSSGALLYESYPVVFIFLAGNVLTWRGKGQTFPKGKLAGVGIVHVFVGGPSNDNVPAYLELDESLYAYLNNRSPTIWQSHKILPRVRFGVQR